jgi:hypothetical protein
MQGLLYDALVAETIADRNRRATEHYRVRSGRRRRRVPRLGVMWSLLSWHPRAG